MWGPEDFCSATPLPPAPQPRPRTPLKKQAVGVLEGRLLEQFLRESQGGRDDSAPGLPIKKWGLEGQEECFDLECFGGSTPNAYDSLINAQPPSDTPVYRFFVVSSPHTS